MSNRMKRVNRGKGVKEIDGVRVRGQKRDELMRGKMVGVTEIEVWKKEMKGWRIQTGRRMVGVTEMEGGVGWWWKGREGGSNCRSGDSYW